MQKKFLWTSLIFVGMTCSSLSLNPAKGGLKEDLAAPLAIIARHQPQQGHGSGSRAQVKAVVLGDIMKDDNARQGTRYCPECVVALQQGYGVMATYAAQNNQQDQLKTWWTQWLALAASKLN